jgi:hypothetical protein
MWENIYKSAVKFTKNEDAPSILRSLEHQSAIFFTKIQNYEAIEGVYWST